MKKTFEASGLVIAICFLFISANVVSGLHSMDDTTINGSQSLGDVVSNNYEEEKTIPITFSIYGKTGITKHTAKVTIQEATEIYNLFTDLKVSIGKQPSNEKTFQLQHQFLSLLKEKNVIPTEVSTKEILSLEHTPHLLLKHPNTRVFPFQNKASEFFCNFATFGEGSAFPIIILPRLIPFLLSPIPRAFVWWSTPTGITSVGGLISGTGFIAGGEQKGFALGFWGIGFSIFLPPIRSYGIFGYALFTRVTAEQIEFYPPNNPPEITQTDPADGQQMVPTTITELRFEIQDEDQDQMSYNVTTEPNIGSGSGGLKPDGTYAIQISGLESLTNYSWYIQVTDGKDTVTKLLTFRTEPTAPLISSPIPTDGERDVSIDLTNLKFTLKDYQGDAMSYTVETSPDIGSGSGSGAHNGTYTIPVMGLAIATTYRWYVNVTDGTHWTRKVFTFETGYPSQFDPFEYGWQYRKQVTIDHSQVLDDFVNFPVLISTNDTDLSLQAQADGGDIMFMNNVGVSTRIYHDLESYDAVSGSLVAWMKMPTLSSTTNTVVYMYYGNPTCINQEYPEKTWDTTYEAVWHMNDATITTISDSTSHHYTGTKLVPNEPHEGNGKVGGGQDFDGTDGYLQYTDSIIPLGSKTISAWMNRYSTQWKYAVVLASSTGISSDDAGTAWSFLDGSNTLQCVLGNGHSSGHYMTIYVTVPDTNSWHYYTMTYDETSLKVYVDGVLAGSSTTKLGNEENPEYSLRMGKTNHPSYTYYLNAGLDEIQVSNVVRNDAWIQTSYVMMNTPANFLWIGPEVPHP